ncbi:unnamed protein product [Acanthoscelides obtectus]|uniref:Uncharacterized protein n=1 Tax=Acanthoscelides obtectus TaxID=200917 RepID=A0A9P0PD93_ACAOB|nr:unnamed protein product [Acanthoscelides obtectus]CAK1660669.1 hypothetical protein AOBTE_LOCUS22213 [Acanthoscelides obtectus]
MTKRHVGPLLYLLRHINQKPR